MLKSRERDAALEQRLATHTHSYGYCAVGGVIDMRMCFAILSILLFSAELASAQVIQRRVAPATPATESRAVAAPDVVMAQTWERLPGCAWQISIASLDRIYAVACGADPRQLGSVTHWREGGWDPTPLIARRVAAAHGVRIRDVDFGQLNGVITVNPQANAQFARDGDAPGSLGIVLGQRFQDAGAGGGWVWGVQSAEGDHAGGLVLRTNKLNEPGLKPPEWHTFANLYAKRIGVGLTDGIAWAIGEDGRIYRQVNQGDGWDERPGCATAIANGGSDQVWVVGCDEPDAAGNRGIYQWNGTDWKRVGGYAKEIAVQSDGRVWVVQADGTIWRRR